MFLKTITLKNFKNLEDISLSFIKLDETQKKAKEEIRKNTFILGENGTGKSNLLKAIALVTSGSNALGQLLGDTDNWIRMGQKSCSINAVLETKTGKDRNISLNLNRGDHLSKITDNNRESLARIDDAIEKADRNYFVVAYGASRRLSSDPFQRKSEPSNRSVNVKNLFDSSFPLNPLTSWIIDLDYSHGKKGLDIVKEALNHFLTGITFDSINKGKKQVMFKTVDGVVSLEQLSEGYQNMAAWIGDLLYRVTETFGDFKNPLIARGLLLIDEIDIHIHPKWQRKLYDFINNKLPNFQVVATTHSPLTAQQADEGELYALKRNDSKKVEVIPFIGSPKKLLVNQLLMTPVFGLETDESYDVEKTKNEYDNLKSKGMKLSASEKKKFNEVKKKLKENLPRRDMPSSSEKEIKLLEKIESKLKIK